MSSEQDTGRRVRRPLLATALGVLAFLVLLASASDALPWASGFDLGVHSWVISHRTAALTSVAATVTSSASSTFTTPLVFVVAAALTPGNFRARLVRACLVLAVMLSAVLCRYGISELIARPRPSTADWMVQAGGLSFPSGHTSDGALAAGLIGWLVVRRFAGRVTPWVVWLIAAAYALLIAWTRVYLGVHWPTDVLGSLAFATAWLSGPLVLQRLDEHPLPATTAQSGPPRRVRSRACARLPAAPGRTGDLPPVRRARADPGSEPDPHGRAGDPPRRLRRRAARWRRAGHHARVVEIRAEERRVIGGLPAGRPGTRHPNAFAGQRAWQSRQPGGRVPRVAGGIAGGFRRTRRAGYRNRQSVGTRCAVGRRVPGVVPVFERVDDRAGTHLPRPVRGPRGEGGRSGSGERLNVGDGGIGDEEKEDHDHPTEAPSRTLDGWAGQLRVPGLCGCVDHVSR